MTLKHSFTMTVFICMLLFFALLAPTEGYARYPSENMIVLPQVNQAFKAGISDLSNVQEEPTAKISAMSEDGIRIPHKSTIDSDHLSRPVNNPNNHHSHNSTVKPTATEPLHTHHYNETVVESTCSSDGYTLHQCVCGDSYTNSETEALGHNYTFETVYPTTISGGYDLYTCSRCGHHYEDNYTDLLPTTMEPGETDFADTQEPNDATDFSEAGGTLETEDNGFCSKCGRRNKTSWCPIGCFTFSSDTVCECGVLVHAGECHNHDTGGGYTGGGGTPETEDYGFCPECDRRILTSWYPEGCFTYLVDTVCECGVLVHAMECHHH